MKLESNWITGFVDGEGCFHVGVNPHKEMTVGYQVLPEFTVVQHERDVQVLHAIKEYFGCGVVRKNHGNRMAFRVRNQQHLADIVIPFFDKFPLMTKKQNDFKKFRQVILKMQNGEHLRSEGIVEIRKIASLMNRGQPR